MLFERCQRTPFLFISGKKEFSYYFYRLRKRKMNTLMYEYTILWFILLCKKGENSIERLRGLPKASAEESAFGTAPFFVVFLSRRNYA
jgi:hypothetical protein